MKRFVMLLVGTVVLLGSAQTIQAQAKTPFIFAGGGASLPMGDYKDYAKTGWMATAGAGYNLTAKFWIAAEGLYGSNTHKGTSGTSGSSGDKTTLTGFDAGVGYALGQADAKIAPYVVGGAGLMSHKYVPATGASESTSKLMYYGGVGLYFPMGKTGFWVEARYVQRPETGGNTTFVPVMAGVTINLGKK